jgi:prepilin-type N-terminal cleavage/methylation domain-containing protein
MTGFKKGARVLIRKRGWSGINRGENGFTLLEILLVLAILAIIALIVVPNFGWLTGRGHEEACQMEERLMKSVTVAYATTTQTCPDSLEDLLIYLDNVEDILGSYSFGGEYPDCIVTQESCPD